MARNVPETPLMFGPMSERRVFESLQELPDSWTILVDVPVGLFGRPTPDMRQIDLLLLHEHVGILVLEVKGGAIKVEQGTWWTSPAKSNEWHQLQRSPFSQAADQRFTLQRYLAGKFRVDRRCFSHAVAFPGSDVSRELGPDAPREIAIDATDLRDPEQALRRARSHWGECPPISQSTIDAIIDQLKPTFQMAVLSSSVAAATVNKLDRETRRQADMVEGQIEVYRTLLSRDRITVLGGAGTGKTVVAAKLARQMTETGGRTLLVCHRPGVQAFLYTLLGVRSTERSYDGTSPDLLHVTSWSRLSKAVATHNDRDSIKPSDDKLSEFFLEFREALPEPYDVLVMDEGQEFTPLQFEALQWLLTDPDASPVYVFADPFQHSGLFSTAVRDRLEKKVTYRWVPPSDFETVLLTTNCRNSRPIATFAGRFYPEFAPAPLVGGPEPVLHRADVTDVLNTTFALVSKLLTVEGFHPNQILVVLIGSPLKDAERAAVRYGLHSVLIENVYRFPLTPKDLRIAIGRPDDVQGLEADVTVIAYSHTSPQGSTLREMYIAASRARGLLHVVSNLPESEILSAEGVNDVLNTRPEAGYVRSAAE